MCFVVYVFYYVVVYACLTHWVVLIVCVVCVCSSVFLMCLLSFIMRVSFACCFVVCVVCACVFVLLLCCTIVLLCCVVVFCVVRVMLLCVYCMLLCL